MTLIYILFYKTVQLSFMGCLIVVCILISRKIIKNKIGIKFQYALWFILILRLLLPVTPSSNLSLYNYIPLFENTKINTPAVYHNNDGWNTDLWNTYLWNTGEGETDEGKTAKTSGIVISKAIGKTGYKSMDYKTFIRKAIPFIWISGVFILGSVIFINNALFLRRVRKCPHIDDQNVLSILYDCKNLMKLSKNVDLVKTNVSQTPCVLNFIKPIILLPEYSLEKCNLIHLKYILLHELAHVKRKDIFINYIVNFLCIIYWFNPLIWYGFHKMREDREICCDSLALSVLRENEVISYGFSIIKIAEISLRAPYLPSVAGIINKKSKIKRRIEMIKIFKKNSYRLSAFALALLLLTGITFLTGATETKATSTEETSTKRIADKTDYPFVNDKDAVGKWETVDFVKEIEDFKVNETSWPGDLYLKSINLLPDGQMTQPVAAGITSDETTPVDWLTWTKGYIIHHNDKTAGKYVIEEIYGSKYMFWEWKSGDYSFRGMKPYYYVLKQVD